MLYYIKLYSIILYSILRLRVFVGSPSALTRSTMITAVKFTITDQVQAIDPLLKSVIKEFLSTLQDSDLDVRRVALVRTDCYFRFLAITDIFSVCAVSPRARFIILGLEFILRPRS